MTTKNLSKNILEIIKKNHITPKPRWTFLLRDYTVWVIGALSLFIGGLAFSVIIYLVKNNDWDAYIYINDSLAGFILLTLPYFWIVFLLLFILAAHYNIKHTKKGYKYKLRAVIIGTVFLSLLLGTLLYNIGAGQAIEEIISEKIPIYEKYFQKQRGRWLQADYGFLAGKIINIHGERAFSIIDLNSGEWNIIAEENAAMPMVKIRPGEQLRIIGKKLSEHEFRARRILPGSCPMRKWFRGGNNIRNGMRPTINN